MKKRPTKVERGTAVAMLPRVKLLAGTTAVELTDQELLATLLKTSTRDCNVLELVGRILKQFGSLYDLSTADWRELKQVYGLGTVRSLELYSMFEFGRRAIRRPISDFKKEPFDSAVKRGTQLTQAQEKAAKLAAKGLIEALEAHKSKVFTEEWFKYQTAKESVYGFIQDTLAGPLDGFFDKQLFVSGSQGVYNLFLDRAINGEEVIHAA